MYAVPIVHLSDAAYPDDPDRPLRHAAYGSWNYEALELRFLDDQDPFLAEVYLKAATASTASIRLNVDLRGFIPSLPSTLENDAPAARTALVNQEWNRNQVAFLDAFFEFVPAEDVHLKLHPFRLDLARNCLQSYLWEIILYAAENPEADNPSKRVLYHGWFSFPEALYQAMFEQLNGRPFAEYRQALEQWEDETPHPFPFRRLGIPDSMQAIGARARNNEEYPLAGERLKKQGNILHPKGTRIMQDFLTDQTQFATFSPPGCYRNDDPRSTTLGRFQHFEGAAFAQAQKRPSETEERLILRLRFSDDAGRKTDWWIGGFAPKMLPVLPIERANEAWMSSMGIGNHPFYEGYTAHRQHDAKTDPWFSALVDAQDLWLDSHAIGMDGPLMHWDADVPGRLHVWMLSFERHALIGHYVLDFPDGA